MNTPSSTVLTKRLTSPSLEVVEEAVHRLVARIDGLQVLLDLGARPLLLDHPLQLAAELEGAPPEVDLEDLTDVHAARHAERVQDDDRPALPSCRYGMSSSGRMRLMTPLLPWRPAILSPTWSLRLMAM